MDDLQGITSAIESVSLIGFMLLSLRYVDTLRREEQASEKERTQDIVDDWKKLRDIER